MSFLSHGSVCATPELRAMYNIDLSILLFH